MTPFRKPQFVAAILAACLLTVGSTHGASAVQPADVPSPDADAWTIPIPPPKCTRAQAATGDVGDCLLAFSGDPTRNGFGDAPAPGVGAGWNWTGSSYNGSPALAAFEAENLAKNSETVAGFGPGYLETNRAIQVLVEGFLNEISASGYEVRHVGAYSFRCTSGNGGWSCPTADPDDLSLHAWGLAFDMNSGANPIVSYGSQDGLSACLTPIQTDLPRWAIQVAEKWGLYWGGYGWNSGCNVAGVMRTSVVRDPPHFEFRGTPEQARAIAKFNGVSVAEPICHDIVDESGRDDQGCNFSGTPEAFWRLPVELDAPTGTKAAIINLTATQGEGPGYLTLESCDAREAGPRKTSAVTFAADETVATMAIVPVDDNAPFCVYRSTGVHSIVDVIAFLSAEESDLGDPLWFTPTTPSRLLDTRETAPVGARAELPVPTIDPVPASGDETTLDTETQDTETAPDIETAPDTEAPDTGPSTGYVFANVAAIDGTGPATCRPAHAGGSGQQPNSPT